MSKNNKEESLIIQHSPHILISLGKIMIRTKNFLTILILLLSNTLYSLLPLNEPPPSNFPLLTQAPPTHIQEYLRFLGHFPNLKDTSCSHELGEIEIIFDPEVIIAVEKIQEEKWLKKGYPTHEARHASRIGIIHNDPYWVWIRDAVLFPSGIFGTYNRIIWRSNLDGKPTGAIVLLVTTDGNIILNVNHRHATRSWEIELPRGLREPDEAIEDTAIREAKEETGYDINKLIKLGEIAADSGLTSSIVPIYFAKVTSLGYVMQDDTEAIHSHVFLSKNEAIQGLIEGYLMVKEKGEKVKVPFRDAALAFAILSAEQKGLL